jgi:hypothetical protein
VLPSFKIGSFVPGVEAGEPAGDVFAAFVVVGAEFFAEGGLFVDEAWKRVHPRLKPERLERGCFRSAKALLPRINAGAPAERRRGGASGL